MLEISFSIIKLLYNVKYDTFFIVNLVHVYIKQYDSVIRLRLPNDKIIKPGPSSEYIFKQCTLHVCSGLLMWTVFFISFLYIFFLKIDGEVACTMSGMHVRMFHIFCENIKSYTLCIMNIIHARYIQFLSHFSSLGEQGLGILICSLACNINGRAMANS